MPTEGESGRLHDGQMTVVSLASEFWSIEVFVFALGGFG